MSRYSRIKLGNTNKSRSTDFPDLQSFPDNYTKPMEPIFQKSTYNRTQETQQIKSSNTHNDSPSDVEEEDGQHDGNNTNGTVSKFGVPKLTRNGSVSSTTCTASKRFKLGKQQSSSPRTRTKETVQSVVKRAFSMRRSSSVSERYCRIHDQYVTLSSPFNDDGDDDMENDTMQTTRSLDKKKKKKGLLKTCKRFFGL